MSRPVPPPRTTWRGVWEKDKLLERAAGVAESSGRIQVSVKPKMLRVDCKEKAEIKSALLTADWQFHKPTEKEGGAVAEVENGAQVSRIVLPSACNVRSRLRDNRNGFETQGWKERGQKRWVCEGKGKIIVKCVASFVARVKSRRKKS